MASHGEAVLFSTGRGYSASRMNIAVSTLRYLLLLCYKFLFLLYFSGELFIYFQCMFEISQVMFNLADVCLRL